MLIYSKMSDFFCKVEDCRFAFGFIFADFFTKNFQIRSPRRIFKQIAFGNYLAKVRPICNYGLTVTTTKDNN